MSPRDAFRAGLEAWRRGERATRNPHDEWHQGAAWALGWNVGYGWRPKKVGRATYDPIQLNMYGLGMTPSQLIDWMEIP